MVFDFRFGDGFLAIAFWMVGGPVGEGAGGLGEVDDEVAAFFSADGCGPPHFEEVAGAGVVVGGEVDAAVEVGEEFCGAGAVGVPAAEDFFPVLDAKIGEAGEGFFGEGLVEAELLDAAEEDEIGGAGAEGGADFLEVLFEGSAFEADVGGEAIDVFLLSGVSLAAGHGFDGGEDLGVDAARALGGGDLSAGGERDAESRDKEEFHTSILAMVRAIFQLLPRIGLCGRRSLRSDLFGVYRS